MTSDEFAVGRREKSKKEEGRRKKGDESWTNVEENVSWEVSLQEEIVNE